MRRCIATNLRWHSVRASQIPRAALQLRPSVRWFSASPAISDREKEALKLLQSVKHPQLNQDIVFSGHLKGVHEKDGVLSVTLQLDQQYRTLKGEVTRVLQTLPWVQNVRVSMDTPPRPAASAAAAAGSAAGARGAARAAQQTPPGLRDVKTILAVHSCKGGVGKSTVAVNVAYSLAQLQNAEGAPLQVGLFDADVYGPSLPTMVSPRDTTLRSNPQSGLITPPVYEGVKTMSYGYATAVTRRGADGGERERRDSGSAVMRGPMVSQVVTQLATQADWGALDYLVLDLPPGTGDIVITLCQQLQIGAALVVTTPQKLSFIDVVKGLDMFDRLRVPVIGVVENMAYFTCGSCSTKHTPFGPGYRRQLVDNYGIKNTFELPIFRQISEKSDSGDPFVLDHRPETLEVRNAYAQIARAVHNEIGRLRASGGAAGAGSAPTVVFDAARGGVVVTSGDGKRQRVINAAELRRQCRCAACVDELSGQQRLKPESVPDDVRPLGIQRRGNYAVAVHWSDGHASSIYPYDVLLPRDAPSKPEA